ncbi:MAG: methyltransferase domain-containing protein, partial [Patescibacteria group bacterium]
MKDYKSLCILGRQPTLGLAELESLYGAECLLPLPGAALLDIPAGEINFKRLGGTIKVARLLTILPSSRWADTIEYLTVNVPNHLRDLPEGTFTLGVSVYGIDVSVKKLGADLLSLKKIIKASGRSVRIVPNKELSLNSAQVLHNKLTHRGAWELLLVRDGSRTILAQTMFVQDIEAYAARDQARPKRDARIGMLPPKLAQILINLSVPAENRESRMENVEETPNSQFPIRNSRVRVLDPFCGTGVILQEALLMGYHVIGTDIDPRMVDYAKDNIRWLVEKYQEIEGQVVIEAADAILYQWPRFSVVASEVYLGRPLASLPQPEKLKEIVRDVDTITKKFLANIAPQLKVGQCLALAIPAWRDVRGATSHMWHLPVIDRLTDMGYNRRSFVHVKND